MLIARSIFAIIHGLFLIALSITLFVLAIMALFSGAFTTFVIYLALNSILSYTALRGATQDMKDLTAESDARNAARRVG